MRSRRFSLFLYCLPLVLAGCGFHLAGASPILENVKVVYEQPYQVVPPPLVEALEARLSSGGHTHEPSKARLVINAIETTQRVGTLSPLNGEATAYTLTTTVHFDFLVGQEMLLTDQTLSTRRVYSYDDNQRLAAMAKQQELQVAMQKDLADLMILRLDTVLEHHPGKLE